MKVELTKRGELGYEVKAEVKSSGVVQQVVAVSTVDPKSEAATAGMRVGDRLYQINGQMQDRWLHAKATDPKKSTKLVSRKLAVLGKAKKSYTLVLERLDISAHADEELAATLRVAKERMFGEWLEKHGLEKYSLKLVKAANMHSIEQLKLALQDKDEAAKVIKVLVSSAVGMRKADLKKLRIALDEYEVFDDSGGTDGGERPGGGGEQWGH